MCAWRLEAEGSGYHDASSVILFDSRPRETENQETLEFVQIAVLHACCIFQVLTHLLVIEMIHSSNVMIHGSTFNSAQGDIHIHSWDSESGMHDFRSVQKGILIDDSMKDFTS